MTALNQHTTSDTNPLLRRGQGEALRIIISGGGTGGHIFPAIAIANAIKHAEPSTNILFVGAEGRMEMEKVPAAGYVIIGLPVAGFQRKITLKNVVVVFKLIKSLIKARSIIKQFKPHAVVGVGGYASGPMLWWASQRKIPTLIQEQNSYAGVTNRLLSKNATKICVAYQGMEKYFPAHKIILTGNPVRQDIENIGNKREEALQFFGLDPNCKTILSIGGSLGARTLNQSITAHIEDFKQQNVQLIWQCGGLYFNGAQELLNKSNAKNIKLFAFIARMDLAYAAADVVISRAGASSISELCLAQKAAILVPSPNVAEDHQTQNALSLVNKNAAIMVKDTDAKEILMITATELIKNEFLCVQLSENIAQLALHNSAKQIADEVILMC